METKIEEVLEPPNPASEFKVSGVDPIRFADLATRQLSYSGNREALLQIEKLVDFRHFFFPVRWRPGDAQFRRNVFTARTEFRLRQGKQWWAEAMAETSLSTSLHDEMLALSAQAYTAKHHCAQIGAWQQHAAGEPDLPRKPFPVIHFHSTLRFRRSPGLPAVR